MATKPFTFTGFNADVRPGDTLLDCVGRPYFRVTRVDQARAKGYLVFSGENLQHRDGAQTAGGHRSNPVTIRRGEL